MVAPIFAQAKLLQTGLSGLAVAQPAAPSLFLLVVNPLRLHRQDPWVFLCQAARNCKPIELVLACGYIELLVQIVPVPDHD